MVSPGSSFKTPRALALAAAFFGSCFGVARAGQGSIQDSESASHDDSASRHEVVAVYEHPGFEIVQFNLAVLSHYSYVLVSDKEALVVDPSRDVTVYLDFLRKGGLTLKGVFLTHSHADFVAGHLELAKATGCPIFQSVKSGVEYPFEAVRDGSTSKVGRALLHFIETPGHTPDGVCALVHGEDGKTPRVLFTGDTLFVGSVGRPDLLGGQISAAALAAMAYRTWTEKLSKLPNDVAILPAHGAGSLCGAHLGDEPTSTLGAEKASNPYLQGKSRSDFIALVLDGLPEAPQYFARNAAMNRRGPELVDWAAPLPAEVTADAGLGDPERQYVVDLRSASEYAAGHLPGSVNVGVRGRLETWVGIMVPWEAKLVLAGAPKELEEAAFRLHRVGYRGGVTTPASWAKAGLRLAKTPPIEPVDLHARMLDGTAPVIVDVRLPSEWMGLRIGNVVNLPLSHLDALSAKLDPAEPVVAVCNSAYRSSMAIGVLERRGFAKAQSLEGGSEAWIAAGLPVLGPKDGGEGPAPAAAPRRIVNLPDRIAPADLRRSILDLPGTFDLVDIRPEAAFEDYSVPGSTRVDLADLISNPAWLVDAGPLVIVDRDGSLAMAVAGILSQKTTRRIRALHGGLEAYWSESAFADLAAAGTRGEAPRAEEQGSPSPTPAGSAPPRGAGRTPESKPTAAPTTAPATAPARSPAPKTSKKKSAGC